MKNIMLILGFIYFSSAVIAQKQIIMSNDIPEGPSFVGYVPNQIVVSYSPDIIAQMDLATAATEGRSGIPALDNIAETYGLIKMIQRYPYAEPVFYESRNVDLQTWFKLSFAEQQDIEQVVAAYKNLEGVIDAQPIGIHRFDARIPNDGFFSEQWHLNQVFDHDVDAPEAWEDQTGNSTIIVGMLDSGVRYYHQDLGGVYATSTNPENSRGNMWINNDELNGSSGIDDDSNSYTDDWIGWDFVDVATLSPGLREISGEDYQTEDNNPRDFNGHGTHCAGNISAINNNGYGTCAVAGGWNDGAQQEFGNGVKIMALRIGYSALYHGVEYGIVQMDFIADALYYAANNGARIVSCSWGSSNSGGLGAAIDYFLASGGLIFKAAGNGNADDPDYMALRSDENLIDVAATDSNDVRSSFSNYGEWVDISAPGTEIFSSVHNRDDDENDYVGYMSGTSMATPIAASVAALIWSANPSLTADQVRTILLDNADNIDALNPSYAGELGSGRVNARAAMNDPSLPVKLLSFNALQSENSILLQWKTASEKDNLGFIIEKSTDEHNFIQLITYLESEALKGLGNASQGKDYQYEDADLIRGQKYWYRLKNRDINGQINTIQTIEVEYNPKSITKKHNFVPKDIALFQNYPNPFNQQTRIGFDIPDTGRNAYNTSLQIFDINGKRIKKLLTDQFTAGSYEISWDGTNNADMAVPSGVYFCRLEIDHTIKISKMMLVR